MVSVTSHLRVIIRPLAVTSIIVLFFLFMFNFNLSSFRSEKSISYAQLGLIGKISQVSSVGNDTFQYLDEIKVTESEIVELTTSTVPHQSSSVQKKELCPLVSPKLGNKC